MSKIVLVTGGFDPIHTGHISYFKNAKELYPNTPLCVGLNSDEWLIRKKGKFFLPMKERRAIVKELKPVDLTITYDDTDNSSCNNCCSCLTFVEDSIDYCFNLSCGSNTNIGVNWYTYKTKYFVCIALTNDPTDCLTNTYVVH